MPALPSRGPSGRVAVLLVLAGAAAVIACAGRPWAQVTVPGLPGPDVVSADGRLLAPGTTALALVAAAGAIVLATSGRAVRLLVAALLMLAGAGVAVLSATAMSTPADAVAPALARVTGMTGAPVPAGARTTAWPLLSTAGGLLVAAGGVVGLARGRRWQGPSRRFERAGPGEAGPEDPGANDGHAEGAPGTKVAGPSAPGPSHRTGVSKDERLDVWDRLSQGEDPTD